MKGSQTRLPAHQPRSRLLRRPLQIRLAQIKLVLKLPQGFIIDVTFIAQAYRSLSFDPE